MEDEKSNDFKYNIWECWPYLKFDDQSWFSLNLFYYKGTFGSAHFSMARDSLTPGGGGLSRSLKHENPWFKGKFDKTFACRWRRFPFSSVATKRGLTPIFP